MRKDEVRQAERVVAEKSCTSPEAEESMLLLQAHWAAERGEELTEAERKAAKC